MSAPLHQETPHGRMDRHPDTPKRYRVVNAHGRNAPGITELQRLADEDIEPSPAELHALETEANDG